MLSFSFTPFSSSVAVSRRLNHLSWFVSFYLSSYSFPQSVIAPVSSCSHLSLPFPTQHLFFLSPPPSLPSSLGVRNACTNSIQIISRKERATRLCQWQFNPWWARCMLCMFQEAVWLHLDLCRSVCCSLIERGKLYRKRHLTHFSQCTLI